MIRKAMGLFCAGALTAGLAAMPAAADTLDDIIKRGKLITGVKADYAP
jgi:ABC-type amino acid transport substrate-binding protein